MSKKITGLLFGGFIAYLAITGLYNIACWLGQHLPLWAGAIIFVLYVWAAIKAISLIASKW
jgi:hypothetical protein